MKMFLMKLTTFILILMNPHLTVATASVRSKSLAKYIPGLCVTRGGIWKGNILVADVEELEKMDASEIPAENGEKMIFPVANGTVKLSGGDQVLRTSTSIRDRPDRGEFQGESDGSCFNPASRLIVA